MSWEHYQTVDHPHPKKIGKGLFGVNLLILSKPIKPYPFRKNVSFPKCLKITQKLNKTAKLWLMR